MEVKRSLTNLTINSKLQLPKSELKKKFLFVFNKGIKGDPYIFMQRLWVSALWPDLANNADFGKSKNIINFLKNCDPAKYAPYTRLEKDLGNQTFKASFLLYKSFIGYESDARSMLKSAFVPQAPTVDYQPDEELSQNLRDPNILTKVIPANVVLTKATWLHAQDKLELSTSFEAINVVTKGGEFLVYANFRISMEVAQQLSSTPWLQLRNIDLYPLLLHWVSTGFGRKSRPLLASLPISTIARTLPENHTSATNTRIDNFGLSLDPDGNPCYIPREVKNDQRYEDLYSQAGVNDDNSFSLASVAKSTVHKLPANMAVLVDWQNLRFAYSNTLGYLTSLDLSLYMKLTSAHAVNILSEPIPEKFIDSIQRFAAAVAVSIDAKDYVQDPAVNGNIEHLFRQTCMKLSLAGDEVTYADLGMTDFKPVLQFLTNVYRKSVDNLEVVYLKYSVIYSTELLGMLGTIVEYGSRFQDVQLEAQTTCKAALNQDVAEGWEMPSVPLLSPKVGVLPHQKKVRNIMKDSPDLAIFPIQAGGGKTPLAIIDILSEIKAGTGNPYLILCPGHLVPQYVREIVFFTDGKLNVIPINSYVIRTSGYARLKKIFEAAPRNTVVICDYDALRYRASNIIYGTSPVSVFPVIEFLRQFDFGYCLLDESHYVKNPTSRSKAAKALIASIPKKRLASGTMSHDSISDLAIQIGLLDPSLFGSRDAFNNKYGETLRGSRVQEWKPGAAADIMNRIKSRVVVAGAMRKEWAALLPQPTEKFVQVTMTPAQVSVYQSILQETLEIIKAEAKTNPGLATFINPEAPKEGESLAEDEEFSENLEALLRPYLARLEQFLTAPARDPLGDKLLVGDDRVSPKVHELARLIREHDAMNSSGKVLIFTNYTAGAEEIYANMPADLRDKGILYVASNKVEALAEFETSPKKTWMVGVENSINTGNNIQFVDCLLRTDTVWNPGTLEQGNSRVNRPELKKVDRRDSIYYYWLVTNGTIDITKIARLISKIVSISKFENAEQESYTTLKEMPVIAMTLQNVIGFNTWDDTLLEYFDVYREFKSVQYADYEEYRNKHGELKLESVPIAPTPPDAMLLSRVPYVAGLELYNQAELGLIRIDEYLRLDPTDEEAEEDGGSDDEDSEGSISDPQGQSLVGRLAHTEYGEGIIIHVSRVLRKIRIRLNNGMVVRFRPSTCFLVTREETSTRDIRNQLLKSVGALPISTPIDVPAAVFKAAKITKRELRLQQKSIDEKKKTQKALTAELDFTISNGFLSVSYVLEDDKDEVAKSLEALGFRPTEPFVYAEVTNAPRLVKQFNVWREAGFNLDKSTGEDISAAFRYMHDLLKTGSIAKHRAVFKFSQASALRNFYRTEMKPSNDEFNIKPYPMIEDGRAYIVLPLRGQSGTKKAIQYRAPGVKFAKSPASLSYFCPTMAKALAVLKLVSEAGIQISNLPDLKKTYTKIKMVKFRSED